ncbi:MAG: hypothetical protein DRR04_08340 [Gammaproteobacteria bacterium]|nr:MAG: hypothetical protein DRQ97_10285 [Gammaproteobacteria bacterium]RLA59492.1 MAG: hypothetical protein DRR04_08340 [Gammaproteobacteria bacterium]
MARTRARKNEAAQSAITARGTADKFRVCSLLQPFTFIKYIFIKNSWVFQINVTIKQLRAFAAVAKSGGLAEACTLVDMGRNAAL